MQSRISLGIENIETGHLPDEGTWTSGDNIIGSGFDFNLKIKEGAGAFVCGEETALIASIEGKRGTPRTRPPFPTTSGLWGKPTVINNVETMAGVALIMQKGPGKFSEVDQRTVKVQNLRPGG